MIGWSTNIDNVYQNIDEYNPSKKRKITVVFDDMITQKLPPRVTKLFIWGRKLGISVIFITQSYFRTPKDIRLNCTHYFLMGISNKKELQQISYNHSAEMDFSEFKELYKRCTRGKHDFLVLDMTLLADNPRRHLEKFVAESNPGI